MPDVTYNRQKLTTTTKTMGDYNLAHRFNVEIDGVQVGGVHTVTGLETEHDMVEWQTGEDIVTHFRPGRHKPGKVHLEKDFSATSEFFNWRQAVVNGKVDRKSISIIMLADDGTEALRFNLFDCYPTKWTGPSLNAKQSAHATEGIDIIFERMEMKTA